MSSVKLATAFVEVTATGLQTTKQQFEGLRGGVQSSLDQIGKLLAPIGAAAGGLLGLGINAAMGAEEVETAFTVMLGSAERARDMIAELNTFSLVTPFTPTEVNKSARTLLAFGIEAEKITDTLNLIGDVSAGSGAALGQLALVFGQIKSTGRLMGQDLLQLINAGFNPLVIISEKTGKSVADLKKEMEQGKISFDQVEQAFRDATSEGGLFNEAMLQLSKTAPGLKSTLVGNMQEIAKAIGREALPAVKTLLTTSIALSKSFVDLNKESAGLVAQMIAISSAAFTATAALVGARIAVRTLGITMRGALMATGVGALIIGLSSLVGLLYHATRQGARFGDELTSWDKAANNVILAWENIKIAAQIAFDAIAKGFNDWLGVDLKMLGAGFNEVFSNLALSASEFTLQVAEAFRTVAENAKSAWGFVTASGSAAWGFLVDVASNFADEMKAAFMSIVLGVKSAFGTILEFIGEGLIKLFGMVDELETNLPSWAQRALGIDTGPDAANSIIPRKAAEMASAGKAMRESADRAVGDLPQVDLFAPSQQTLRSIEEAAAHFFQLGKGAIDVRGSRESLLNRLAPPRPPVAPEDEEQEPEVTPAASSFKTGFQGFEDLSRSLQEAFIKTQDPQEKLVDVAEQQKTLQEKMVASLEKLVAAPSLPVAE